MRAHPRRKLQNWQQRLDDLQNSLSRCTKQGARHSGIVLRNLSEPVPVKTLFDSFKAGINALTIRDTGSARIEDRIRLRQTRPCS